MSDDEPLGLPPMLPPLMSRELSPFGSSVNVLDMINQDLMLGNSYQSSASTEVTYVSQYTSPSATPFYSAAPFTSAGDVFLPSIPITTAANTFVKPLHKYTPSSGQTEKPIVKPSPRFAKPKCINLSLASPIVSHQHVGKTQCVDSTLSKSEKPKKSSKKSSSRSSKKSKSRSRSSHKSSSRSKSSKKSSHSSRSKSESLKLHSSMEPSAFVSVSSRSGYLRSPAVTHTLTHVPNILSEADTYTTPVARTIGQGTTIAQSSSKTATVTSFTATKTQSRAKEPAGPYSAMLRSNSLTTSTVTSSTVSKPRTPASIISPMERTYLPSSIFRPGPNIVSCSPASDTQPSAQLPAIEKSRERMTKLSAQKSHAVSTSKSDRASIESEAKFRSQARVMYPVKTCAISTVTTATTTATTVKHHVLHTGRPAQNPHMGITMQTCGITTTTTTMADATSCTLTPNTFALRPGATLYRKIPSVCGPHSRSAMTTEPKTLTILDGKGSYTTLTFSSDLTTTTGSPVVTAQTQNATAVTAGLGTQSSTKITDTMIRPGSQLIIPIPNSQMNTSTSLGYLVTSPMGVDLMSTRNSSAAGVTQARTTTPTVMGTHTITTISSEAFNRIRSRLICNAPTTAAGLVSPSTTANESSKPRGQVTIIANQLISAATPRDGSVMPGLTSSRATAASRTRVPAAQTQGLYAVSTPVTTHSTTTILDHMGRPVNRMVIPISQNLAPAQGTYILTTGIGQSSSTARDSKTRHSHKQVHGTATAATTLCTTTAVTATTCVLSGATGGSATPEVYSKLRNRLTSQVITTRSSMLGTTTPITAYAISKSRPVQGIYAVPPGSVAYRTSANTTKATTLNPATMTLITFSPPNSGGLVPTATGSRQLAAHSDSPSSSTSDTSTSATPTLTNTGNRYIIKLATTPSGTTASTITTGAVTTPITTAALDSMEHPFLEPHPVPSRLRTFPAPRTYPVAQRLAVGNQQRPPVRSVNTRAKKVIANPAPLQIFADVVNPPSTAQTVTTNVSVQGHNKPRFTLSHASSSSTLVVPHYRNLSTIAQPSLDRTGLRLIAPLASSERLVLNRPLAFLSPRRVSPIARTSAQDAQTTNTEPQRTAHLEQASSGNTRQQVTGESSPNYEDHLFE